MLKGHPDIRITVRFLDKLYQDAVTICENEVYKDFLQNQSSKGIEACNKLNGLYLIPKDIHSQQFILVSSRQLKDGYSYISTVAHETKHAIDHTAFAKKYYNGRFEDIGKHEYSPLFEAWGEYVAHKIGHSVFISCAMNIILGMSEDEIKDELSNNQMPIRISTLQELMKQDSTKENVKEILSTLAKFAIWESDLGIDISDLSDILLTTLRNLNRYDDSARP
ncbi:hypothetical protein [Oscillibacter sp.]|uniref:hypothetical protein n=1 Tax=Oscillibacter sp. TaxID=1945593 RepID=UPI0028B1B9BE|nr:hypothetical protein [Oscillibacter sp.]